MNPPSDNLDIVAFDNSFSQEALRKYRQLFPDSTSSKPQKPSPPASTYSAFNLHPSAQSKQSPPQKRRHREKMNLPPADSHYRKWIRQIVDRKKKLSVDFIRSINGLNEQDKKIEIWQRPKHIKQKKNYMPQVISNPFEEESQQNSRSFSSRPKSSRGNKRERKRKCSGSSDQVQNPFFKECLEQLQSKNEVPLSKTQQKMHKIQRKCLEMLNDLKVEESTNNIFRTAFTPHSQLKNPENSQSFQESSVKRLSSAEERADKKIAVKEEQSIETYNQRPNLIQPEYLCQVTAYNQLQKCSTNPPLNLEPTIQSQINSPGLNSQAKQPSRQIPTKQGKVERVSREGQREERQSGSRQRGETRQKGRSKSKQAASLQAEKIKLIQKLQDLELKSLQPDLTDNDFKRIQHTKRKVLKQFDHLTKQQTMTRIHFTQPKKSPSQTKHKHQTEWQKYQREKRQKKETQERLWREYQLAVEERRRVEEETKRPDRASTRQFQDFLDTKEELYRRARNSDRLSNPSSTARSKHQLCSSADRKKSRDKDDQDKYRVQEVKHKYKQDREVSNGEDHDRKHQRRVHRHTEDKLEDSRTSQQGELPRWRQQLKKITGYDPKSSKYRRRDREQIWESGFDRIQYEDKVSKLAGRKEEQEARAYDRQHTINQSDVDSFERE